MNIYPVFYNVIQTFLKIWFTIIIIFSVIFWLSETGEYRFDALLSISGLTLIFSIPLAILLLLVLYVSTYINNTMLKAGFIYLMAFLSITLYCYNLDFDNDKYLQGCVYIAVFVSLILWTNSIFTYSNSKQSNS